MKKNEALNILGLEKSSTEDEIKRAYKRLALLHHPDRHSSKAASIQKEHEELFKQVGEAYAVLTEESKDNSLDDTLNEWFSSFFKFPTKDEYLEMYSELLQKAGLDLNNLKVFNAMTEEEVEIVGYNLGELFDNGCLNQESFDLACRHLSWPNKTEYDMMNPYVSKFIFESLVAKENIQILSECNLSDYEKLVKAFKRLSGDENEGDLGWQPPYPNLVTQERLNYLIEHSSVSDDFAYTITRLAHVNLLTVENETFILTYLPKMADPMLFAYQLLGKHRAQTSEILQQARESADDKKNHRLGFIKEELGRLKSDEAIIDPNEGLKKAP